MLLVAAVLLASAGPGTCVVTEALRGVRPRLSGEELTESAGRFVVHYTLEGADAPNGGDADSDGVPDAVPRVLDALQLGEQRYLELGYRALVPDSGLGGSDALDVYLTQIDANGYANACNAADGELDSCYVRLDPDLGAQPGEILESVAIHELHHCVQFTYTTAASSWVYEGVATMEQYRNLSNELLDAALGVLWAQRLVGSGRAIDDTGDRFEYAAFLFWWFWEQVDGDDAARVALWEALEAQPDWWQTLDAEAARRFGTSLPEAFLEHATWNAFACKRDDGAHYDPSVLPCVFDASVPVEAIADSWTIDLPTVPLTSAYAELPANGSELPVQLTCDPVADGAELGLRLIALDALGGSAEAATTWIGSEGGSVRLEDAHDPDGRFLVVAASTGAEAVRTSCAVARVPAVVEPAAGCGCAAGAVGPWWLGLVVLIRRRRR